MEDLEKQVFELRKLAEENNRLLKKIYRQSVYDKLFRIFYWLIIIGIAIFLFIFIQPYFDSIMNLYGSIGNLQSDDFSLPSNLLKGLDF